MFFLCKLPELHAHAVTTLHRAQPSRSAVTLWLFNAVDFWWFLFDHLDELTGSGGEEAICRQGRTSCLLFLLLPLKDATAAAALAAKAAVVVCWRGEVGGELLKIPIFYSCLFPVDGERANCVWKWDRCVLPLPLSFFSLWLSRRWCICLNSAVTADGSEERWRWWRQWLMPGLSDWRRRTHCRISSPASFCSSLTRYSNRAMAHGVIHDAPSSIIPDWGGEDCQWNVSGVLEDVSNCT